MSDTVTVEGAAPAWRRPLGVAVAVLAVLVLGRLAFAVDAPTDVLELPEEGMVRAAQLDDGTPVFLVHGEDDSVHVVEAFTRRTGSPIGGLVGWCPLAEQFVDPHHGPLYDPRGQRYEVSVPGRVPTSELVVEDPRPDHDLVRRTFERLEGRGDNPDPLLVGEALSEEELARNPLPRLSGNRSLGPPESCRTSRKPLDPGTGTQTVLPRNRILDHSFQATTIRLPRDRWQIADGYVMVDAQARTTWCRVAPEGSPPSCPDEGPVPLDLGLSPEDLGGGWAVIGGPVAARVSDGVVVEIAVLPRSAWRGSSLRGGHTYRARLLDIDVRRNAIVLDGLEGTEPGRCLGTESAPSGSEDEVAVQFVDADTLFDVDGQTDPLVLADLPRERLQVQVEVVADLVTCRALSVTQVG